MSIEINKLKLAFIGSLLGSMACSHVSAEDIEIFVGNAAKTAGNPNIVFILDTSGSMGFNANRLTGAPDPYDATLTYPTATAATSTPVFAGGFYYWTNDGSIPTDTSTLNRVAISNFKCDAATNSTNGNMLGASGIFTDRSLAWDSANERWVELRPSSIGARDVECFSDHGVHGDTSGTSLYADNGNVGPWSNSSASTVWDSAPNFFTFYTANFLNYNLHPPQDNPTRYTVMRAAADQFVRRLSNVNVGLSIFGGGWGGFIHQEVTSVDTLAGRMSVLNSIQNMRGPGGGTPLTGAFYETFRYFTGDTVRYGDDTTFPGNAEPGGPSVAGSRLSSDPSRYRSPMSECGKNYAVLLSDGEPNSENVAAPDVRAELGIGACTPEAAAGGHCLDDIALYADTPRAYPSASTGLHRIQTFTIGFDLGTSVASQNAVSLLKKTAQHDDTDVENPRYFAVNSSSGLTSALESIKESVDDDPSTFTAPTSSVSATNSTLNREFLYYTMFRPSTAPRWDGNLKKYRLVLNNDGTSLITDSTSSTPPVDIIDPNGQIIAAAQSYWSSAVDGNDVTLGGARAEITDTKLSSRNVWTDIGSSSDLSASDNQVSLSNTLLTRNVLAVGTDGVRDEVVQWMRGLDIRDVDDDSNTTESRFPMGDPLHSQPVVVAYEGAGSDPAYVVFYGTNDGYLHAIDEDNGDELFSYIPEELLTIQKGLYDNISLSPRPYGLDGSATVWVDDVNGDGIINPATDSAYLYIGMRRGGRNYYALDITNVRRDGTARLLWKIVDGNVIRDGVVTANQYTELGDTWSKPLVRKIKVGTSAERTVLIAGGGYDTNQDTVTVTTPDSIGRAVYFIDALTGQRVWWAGPAGSGANLELPSLSYSIPSRVSAYDLTGNGLVDRIYVGDMGAQLWRFDVDNGASTVAQLVDGGVIARLNGTGIEGARRFYTPPDAALVVEPTGVFLAIVIGSGYRAHPRNLNIQDRIFMIKDFDVYDPPSSGVYTTILDTNLYDATLDQLDTLSDPTALENERTLVSLSSGWYIDLNRTNGEKNLSTPLILGGVAIVPTYEPDRSTADECAPAEGTGAVYYLNLSDATAVFDFYEASSANDLTREDRRYNLSAGGIPSDTAYIVGLDSDGQLATAVLHGKEEGQDPTNNQPLRTYWFESRN